MCAEVVLRRRERAYLDAPHPDDFPCPRWVTLLFADLDDRLRLVDDGAELLPGVTVVEAHGHSAGSIAVAVETAGGLAVMAGDAVQNVHVARTGRNGLVFWDVEQANATVRRLRSLADVLHPGHDRAFRWAADGTTTYVEPLRLTRTGLDVTEAGLPIEAEVPPEPRIMPGITEQVHHPLSRVRRTQ